MSFRESESKIGMKKNLWYQSLYQILNLILPLITAPFLSRVLGAESLGIISYTTSVVNYFVLFAMLGLTNYGTRSIAVVKNDKKDRNRVFTEIYVLQVFTSTIALIVYALYMVFICDDNILVSWIQGIAILACLFDINWFFFGIEKFKITVIRSMVIRVVSVIMILLFVKQPSDLWLYSILLLGSTFVSQIVLWVYLPKYTHIVKVKFHDVKKHLLPNIKLFIPLLAMSVYHIMDKTMLGRMSSYLESGYYYNADKVINIPIGLLTGVGTVLLPRVSALAGGNNKAQANRLFNDSIIVIGCFSAALCCGIAAIAEEFTPFFFGPGYEPCILLIITLSPVLFIKGFTLISRNAYLIPNNMENKLTASVVAGAIANLVANFLLIPLFGALGAVIGTIIAEFVSFVLQYVMIFKETDCLKSLLHGCLYFLFGVIMYFGVRCISQFLNFSLLFKVIIEVLIGAIIYISLCLIYWKISKNNKILALIRS